MRRKKPKEFPLIVTGKLVAATNTERIKKVFT